MSYTFDQNYYLQSKLRELHNTNETDINGNSYTLNSLISAIRQNNLTVKQHYETYGYTEGLNPNPYFNENEYLAAKLKQLNSVGERDPDGYVYTIEKLRDAITTAGMTPVEHYERFGAYETDARGNYINPSNAFDANAYFQAKLLQVRGSGETVNGHTGANISMQDLMAAMVESGMSPVAHYYEYGAAEATAANIPMVQTVPSSQRVTNDPGRETITDETVPTNYNPATTPPMNVTNPHAVVKPADVGGKVPANVSPTVTHPLHSAPVPGDSDYVAPPSNIVDTNGRPVVAPTTSDTGRVTDNWVVVNPADGSGTMIDQNGATAGTYPPGSITVGPDGEFIIPGVTPPPVNPLTFTATLSADIASFHDGQADTFITKFGVAGVAGSREAMQIPVEGTAITQSPYKLTVGNVTLEAPAPAASTLDALVAALQAAPGYAQAGFTVSAGATGLTITFTTPGPKNATASLTSETEFTTTETTPGEAGAQEVQTIALPEANAKAGAYSLKINSNLTLTVTTEEAGLEALVAKLTADPAYTGQTDFTIEADGTNGIKITYTTTEDVADLAELTPPSGTPITASEATKGADPVEGEAVIGMTDADVQQGVQYTVNVAISGSPVDVQATTAAATVQDLVDKLNTANVANQDKFTFEVADGGIKVVFKEYAASQPAVTLTPASGTFTNITGVETTTGAADVYEIQKVQAPTTITQEEYTLTVGSVELTGTPDATNLANLVEKLKEDADYAAADFEISVDGTDIAITYKSFGDKTDSVTLEVPTGAGLTALTAMETVAAAEGTNEVQTFAITTVTGSENYIFNDGTQDYTVTPAGATVADLVTAIEAIPGYAGKDYTVAAGGDGIEITFKTPGDKTDTFTLTPPDAATAEAITAVEATKGEAGTPEVQNVAIPAVTAAEYTLAFGNVELTGTPATADLDALVTALTSDSDYATAGFTIAKNGSNDGITVTFTDNGDMEPVTLTQAGANIAGTVTTPGAAGRPGTPSTSSFNALDTIHNFNYLEDHIDIPGSVSGSLFKAALSGTDQGAFASAASQVGANQAGLFSYGNDQYLFVNDATASFDPNTDIVIKLAGVSAADAAAMTTAIFS